MVFRLLMLDGSDGSVACRIHNRQQNHLIPRLSAGKRIECVTRSFLRLRNLAVVRGRPGSSMIGPCDYWGNIEHPNRYMYTIELGDDDGGGGGGDGPKFIRHDKSQIQHHKQQQQLLLKHGNRASDYATRVSINWKSGGGGGAIKSSKSKLKFDIRKSLFPNPGVASVPSSDSIIQLKDFDATRVVDLSSRFHARLVMNNGNGPFQITQQVLPGSDEYRIISYTYEPGYVENNPENLFLEKHSFAQTITPMSSDCGGFVVLAAKANQNKNEKSRDDAAAADDDGGDLFDLVAIQIPFGWTLIVDPECIHGDASLEGTFMMTMTSNHVTMQSADTVLFQTQRQQQQNDDGQQRHYCYMKLQLTKRQQSPPQRQCRRPPPPPLVIYDRGGSDGKRKFARQTQGANFIFNPTSRNYW